MNTRIAADKDSFNQERFMSSPELQRGLLANCVASRLQTVNSREHRAIIWWLQKESLKHGDLETVATELMANWPERFVTRGMQELGLHQRACLFSKGS